MKSDARPLCGLSGNDLPDRLKRSIYFFLTASTITVSGLRTCIHSRNRRMGEGFSRQARQIFAGIIAFTSRKFNAAWREKTRPDGESRL
jgi:predicted lysophospholipase L1 biosynthesis ABC-type transport system permease subunit